MEQRTFFWASLFVPRLIGLCYFIAFLSLYSQVSGLFCSSGVTPIHSYLSDIEGQFGEKAFWLFPSVFWLSSSDVTLHISALLGITAGALLSFGILPKLSALLCWSVYLSFVNADSTFFRFQWDALLLEAGFLTLLYVPWIRPLRASRFPTQPREVSLLFQWLLFRLMWGSGIVKLLSGDPTWRNLSALRYHFWTQPLPNPIAYYAAHLPTQILDTCTLLLLLAENLCPFLLFFRPTFRRFAGCIFILLQLLIIASGNFGFFNVLTISICLFAFDDEFIERRCSRMLPASSRIVSTGLIRWPLAFFYFIAIILGAGDLFARLLEKDVLSARLNQLSALAAPLRLVNSYGTFAVMTTERREIVIEGSIDGKYWQPYQFRFKPEDVHRTLPLVAPFQPRLDWQMWFAALGTARQNPWLFSLLVRLAEGSQEVTALLAQNPFRDQPPRFLRALLYEYRFTSLSEQKITQAWWQRKLLGNYLPVMAFEKQRVSEAREK